MMEKEGTEIKMEDAAGFFANIFGGDRFVDYVRFLLLSLFEIPILVPPYLLNRLAKSPL